MIRTEASIEPLFRDLVERTVTRRRLPLSWPAKEYLVDLLVEMGDAEVDDGPVCLKVYSAGPDRTVALKEAGDQALFVSGFFEERVRALGLRPSYYASLGSMAYSELENRLRLRIYGELADKFRQLQEALRVVRSHCDAMGLDYMSAVEQWLRTRSEASETRLAQLGVFVSVPKGPDGSIL